MSRRYATMITKSYVPDWTANNAIREWVANALDDSSKFQYSFSENYMELTSVGVELPFRSLLLGVTTKRDDKASVGTHGEGLLIALGVALREGLEVTIKNGSKLWQPTYEYDETLGEEVLVIYEELLLGNTDLVFEITGVDDDLRDQVVSDCLYLQEDLEETLDGDTGRIILGQAGKLYVGGIYVTDTKMQYSYDFNPDVLKLNRDRKSVESWNLEWETSRLWNSVSDSSVVAEMLFESCPDVRLAKHTTLTSNSFKTDCFNLYKEKYGEVPLAANTWAKDSMEEEGYIDVVVTGNEEFTEAVKESNEYKSLRFEKKEIEEEKSPIDILEDFIYDVECEIVKSTEFIDKLVEVVRGLEKKGVIWE